MMSKEKRRVPKLRFPGFTEDWEQRKFGEIYERAGQKNDLTYGIDKIISVANMYFKKDVTVGSEEYLKTYNVFKLGDIAFEGHTNKEYRYGRFVENTIGDGIVSHIFDVFTPKINLDINFWKDLIKYEPIMGPILRRCTKASRMMSNLTTKEFLEEQILCPTLEEQKLIGEFIVSLDKNITLHQRKLDNLKLKKKALLQKLFPKNGERYPELRFPGFTDAWEQRKLSEFVDKAVDNRGKTPPLDENGAHPLIEVAALGGVYPDYSKVEKYLSDDVFNTNLRAYIKKDDILFTTVGSIGLVSLMDSREEAAIAQNIVAFRAKENFLPEYLYALFSNEDNQYKAKRIAMVAVQPSIKVSQLVNVEYMISTNIEEQERIGVFFSSLQSLITLHQRKLDHLQLQKKALLQQMFV
ncbi:MAG: restriction endonuclease subunit S [Veillonella sp.]|uniref:restriction endonuclease subunit S n=1 Tax=Veillonella sp. TaxID=1926307 RepID=UPI0025DA2CF6|nr:restriction endonuclease subunit S [Veillonella sp.]MBS7051994.1 restriction endonuclease subunit S [Veillonella sp.]